MECDNFKLKLNPEYATTTMFPATAAVELPTSDGSFSPVRSPFGYVDVDGITQGSQSVPPCVGTERALTAEEIAAAMPIWHAFHLESGTLHLKVP